MSTQLRALDARAQASVDEAQPSTTARAYALETACYAAWCTRHGVPAVPSHPRVLRAYLRELADHGRALEDLPQDRTQPRAPGGPLAYGSIARALGAICRAHVKAGLASPWKDPVVEEMMDTLAREKGVRTRKKRAIELDPLAVIVRVIPRDLRGLRDRSLILTGWWGGARRSEISGARIEHFEPDPEGLRWLIPDSKTDQRGVGQVKPLHHRGDIVCPVDAFRDWMLVSNVREGFIFRTIDKHGNMGTSAITPDSFADRIKHYCGLAGMDPKFYAGHSLRRGYITEHRDKPLPAIMAVTGHKSPSTVIGYIDELNVFDRSASKGTRMIAYVEGDAFGRKTP